MQWHKLSDVQPEDGERVVLVRYCDRRWQQARFECGKWYMGTDGEYWWKASPDDQWARVTLPDAVRTGGGEG